MTGYLMLYHVQFVIWDGIAAEGKVSGTRFDGGCLHEIA